LIKRNDFPNFFEFINLSHTT